MMALLRVHLFLWTIATAAFVEGFSSTGRTSRLQQVVLRSQEDGNGGEKERQTLGLLTFDLDDTLYPIAPVVAEANGMCCAVCCTIRDNVVLLY